MRLSLFAFCVAVAAFLAVPSAMHAQDTVQPIPASAEIKFDETLWSQNILDIFGKGTKILDTETPFEMAPSPANDSEQTAQDLATLVRYAETKRSETVVAKILFENKSIPIMEIFFSGGYLDKSNNTKTYAILDMADSEIQYFLVKYKKQFLRARPNVLHPAIETVIPNPPHPAYPSGHGGQSWLAGLILSYVDPDNKDAYMKFAKSVGVRREIAGVHYPSDTAAGRNLAEQVFTKLLENKTFMKKLEDAKISYVKPDLSAAYVVTELDETE